MDRGKNKSIFRIGRETAGFSIGKAGSAGMRHRSGATILGKPLLVSNDLGAYRSRCACVRRVAETKP